MKPVNILLDKCHHFSWTETPRSEVAAGLGGECLIVLENARNIPSVVYHFVLLPAVRPALDSTSLSTLGVVI